MENLKTNPNTHLTAKERNTLSFPARILLERSLLKGQVLDYGCGFGSDVRILTAKGIEIEGYDPYYFPDLAEKKFDTVLCFYVLNVLLPEEQMQVLMNISSVLKPGGKAYFAVRRDLQKDGYRLHKIHEKYTYQCTVKLPFKSIFLNDNCEIYEYQHYTFIHQGKAGISPFFADSTLRTLLFESASVFSFYDKFPVNPGHALVVPKRLVADYFDLSYREQTACWIMVNKIKSALQKEFNPDGYNIGINNKKDAGQTVDHCHIHIIPRYKDDVEDPRGGIRSVIPDKKIY